MISESFSTLWTRWNLRYSVNFSFGISPNILEPLGSSSYRSHLFIYLFISFHDVWRRSGKSHLQVLHVPGSEPRPLSVLYEKRNGTLDFLTASGNNCQGIWRSSGNSLLVFQFFFFISVRAAPYFSHLELQRWRPRLCETRERFSIIEIAKHKCRFVWFNTCKATDWPKSIVSPSQPIRTPTQNQYMLGCCARFTRLALYSPL